MQVTIQDKTIDYTNLPESIEKLKVYVQNVITEGHLFLNSMEIDGVKVYENFYEYVADNIKVIKKLVIEVLTIEEHTYENLSTTKEYLAGALPALSMLIEEFYRVPNGDTWKRFDQLLEGMQWIIDLPIRHQGENELINNSKVLEASKALQDQLKPLIEAVEQKNNVLIADILNYELMGIYEELNSNILKNIDNEDV